MAAAEENYHLQTQIDAQGEAVRQLKAAGSGATPEAIKAAVDQLLALKAQYKERTGEDYPPKAAAPAKKEKQPKQPDPAREGPSKKELKKAAAKEAKKEKKAAAKVDGNGASKGAGPAAAAGAAGKAPVVARPTLDGETVFFSPGRPPVVAYAAALATKAQVAFVPHAAPAPAAPHALLEPQLFLMDGTSLFGDLAIARFLARRSSGSDAQQPPLTGEGAFAASEVDQWLDFAQQYQQGGFPFQEIPTLLATLNSHLELRTYLVGHAPTLADAAVFAFLQASRCSNQAQGSPQLPHLGRWCALLKEGHPELASAHDKVQALARQAAKAGAAGAGGAGAGGGGRAGASVSGGSGTCPPLEGAEEGKVVTRFPPEPSGYLHIGHAKAVLLNDYYAKHYKGKLIIRFDDTNPSKEKDEYEESIIADLKSLGVVGDRVTHTSDYFELMEGYAVKMIEEGKAFMDNTPQEQMQEERMNRKESVNRNNSVQENLERFKAMLAGEKEYCLRAKIDMSSVNGTMRDPVIYRANPLPHHRTGTRFKAYPTYDFACPIVDSIEGVTHALRTTEYNDRDEQYYWMLKALKLRPVKIQSYSRLNFVQTELSKRRLTWFVDNKHVEGWNDPRFPTIQGVMRRGVSVEALRQFILAQGASRRVVLMEWDSFWAINKKGYEATAPRYMAVFKDTAVRLELTNGPAEPSGMLIPLHPKHAELGTRVLRLAKTVFLEGPDAEAVKEGEEVTLARWGNVKVTAIEKDAATGKVLRMVGEVNPQGDPRSTEKKLTWLADVEDVVDVVLTEFDYLITKKKLEEGEDFKDFINPVTKAEVPGLGDPALRNLKKGEVIQLERRGFYICDRPYLGPDKPPVLFMIPDGKTKAMSTLSGVLKHV